MWAFASEPMTARHWFYIFVTLLSSNGDRKLCYKSLTVCPHQLGREKSTEARIICSVANVVSTQCLGEMGNNFQIAKMKKITVTAQVKVVPSGCRHLAKRGSASIIENLIQESCRILTRSYALYTSCPTATFSLLGVGPTL